MNDWQSVYKVEPVDDPDPEDPYPWNAYTQVVNILTGEIVGKYKSMHYAKRQARYRYKKELKKIEKALLR